MRPSDQNGCIYPYFFMLLVGVMLCLAASGNRWFTGPGLCLITYAVLRGWMLCRRIEKDIASSENPLPRH